MNQHEPKDASPSRRQVVLGLAAAGTSLALPFGTTRALAQGRPPFKIGVLNTFSKLGTMGTSKLNGKLIACASATYTIAQPLQA